MKNYITLFLKGMAMGASDVVPGVSGGTIAFISGIYERLINSIKSINVTNLKLLFTGKFGQFWRNVDCNFLLCIVLGIAFSFLTLAKIITHLLETQPIFIWAFFFGLVIASTLFVGRDVKWNIKTIATFAAMAILSFCITSPQNQPMMQNDALWYIFLCGAIAICAMILPGISGSFILVLLGQYQFMLQAISTLNIVVLVTFMCGAIIGIVSFANILSWLFAHFKQITLAALVGFMFGSLNKIWPWKNTLQTYTDSHGTIKPLIQENILPTIDANFATALCLTIAGFAIIFTIEFVSKKMHKK